MAAQHDRLANVTAAAAPYLLVVVADARIDRIEEARFLLGSSMKRRSSGLKLASSKANMFVRDALSHDFDAAEAEI
ncbi:MAG: hypothetical protein R3C60_14590 [Parvularculaceae bacterium]